MCVCKSFLGHFFVDVCRYVRVCVCVNVCVCVCMYVYTNVPRCERRMLARGCVCVCVCVSE
jgi:hypothetical protein